MAAGWLRTERHGRRSRVHLTDAVGGDAVRGRASGSTASASRGSGTGRWLLVVLRVPEERREVRHQVRTRLAWAGFGSLGGGLWITPHVEREAELRDMAGDGSVAELLSFRAELGALGDPARVIADAWDLDGVAEAYRELHRPVRPPAAPDARGGVPRPGRCWCTSGASSRSSIPTCPRRCSRPRWPRSRAHDVFQERHALWAEPAQAYFRSLEALKDPPARSRRAA